jgi:N utilization substance protein A
VRLAARLTSWKIDIKALEPERMPTLQDIFQDIIE